MTGFCTHFGALPALPRAPSGTSLGQEWSKLGQKSKTTTSGEKGHLAKTTLFIRFPCCLGGPWQALGSSGMPVEASQEAEDRLVPAWGHKGSIGIYGNGRK